LVNENRFFFQKKAESMGIDSALKAARKKNRKIFFVLAVYQ